LWLSHRLYDGCSGVLVGINDLESVTSASSTSVQHYVIISENGKKKIIFKNKQFANSKMQLF
jgi:hypothetical protein